MSISVDTAEVREFARNLGKVEPAAVDAIDDALHDIGWEMTEVAAAQASGTRWAKLGRSWTSERAYSLEMVAYEVGPDKAKNRSAGLIGAYLGWPNGGGGTLDLDHIVDRGDKPMLKALGDALDKALEKSL